MTTQHAHNSAPPDTFPCLDGLRGTAAVWVLASHVQILSGTPYIGILSWGGLAVDLFMMLSGLLMAHHYVLRQSRSPWQAPSTWLTFWMRRFFRIAPLYYALLIVVMFIAPLIGEGRAAVANVWPGTATSTARYAAFDLTNALAHFSFVFGALPEYAFRTPLPDWSIGLEMQFYLVFPFVMLLITSLGMIRAGVLLAVGCVTLRWAFPGYFAQFEMPAFLPMKFYVFMIGIWLALGRASGRMTTALVVSLAVAAVSVALTRTSESAGLLVLVLGLYYLLNDGSLPGSKLTDPLISLVRSALSGRIAKYLGDASYGLYLVHLLILIPIAGFLATKPGYVALPHAARFAICFSLTAALAGAIALIAYRLIETPGIQLGKALTQRLMRT